MKVSKDAYNGTRKIYKINEAINMILSLRAVYDSPVYV